MEEKAERGRSGRFSAFPGVKRLVFRLPRAAHGRQSKLHVTWDNPEHFT
jgi:hypothetical protein